MTKTLSTGQIQDENGRRTTNLQGHIRTGSRREAFPYTIDMSGVLRSCCILLRVAFDPVRLFGRLGDAGVIIEFG